MSSLMDNLTDGSLPSILAIAGESILYRPNGGTNRTITALVRRAAPEAVAGPGSGRLTATVITITVVNDAIDGIENSGINIGGDKVDVAVREGETPRTLNIARLLKQTTAFQVFEVLGSGKAA